jgi:hypothetical protein
VKIDDIPLNGSLGNYLNYNNNNENINPNILKIKVIKSNEFLKYSD